MNLDHLNIQQQEAVRHIEGPLLILAGAGSGKTATMTHRIAYLIEQGISPYNILAVTFTNKAAGEMRDRVQRLIGSCAGMWILTFHAMSLRILRENYELAGYEKNFVIYDTVDTKALVKNIVKEKNVDTKQFPIPYLQSVISKQKENDRGPEEFIEYEGMNHHTRVIYEVYKAYEKELMRNNAMDFDDLLRKAYHVLRDYPGIRADYQDRFRFIMVDEYQDTNHIQYEIIRLLAEAHENLCVVGDDDQCIYQWRGADIRNILDFEEDFPDVKVIKLEQNYRSYGNILKAAHSVVKHNHGRKEKELWTEKEDGAKIVYRRANNDKEEADYIAQEIQLLNGAGGYDDFAVLYRTNAQSRLFEDALRRRRIPYQILSGFSFYERKETKDMISYLRLVVNPRDDLALSRIINEPKRGIGPTTLAKLDALARVENTSIFDVLTREEIILSLPSKARGAVKNMISIILLCQQEKDNLRISDIYDNLLVKTGYYTALEMEGTVEAEGRMENLLDFKSFIFDFERDKEARNEKATLEEFLEKVATDGQADKYDEGCGKVTLMTLHGAKGLEFPVVFMPGMEDGLFPGYRSMDDEKTMEEERRLCYVGMTRARERLFLTGAEYRVMYGKGDYTRESQFLREMDPTLFDERGDSVYKASARVRNSVGTDTGSFDGTGHGVKKASPFGYDPMLKAKQDAQRIARGASGISFEIGDQVTHGKFGHGLVVDVDEKTVTVIFDEFGQKRLAKAVAPLKKV